MLFYIFRLVFGGLIFYISFLLIRRSKIINKKRSIKISLLSIIVICALSSLLTIENLFINFKSPEDVFNYSCSGKIEDIVYGNNSCMVVYSTGDNSYSYSIMPKSAKGYKISNLFSTKIILNKFDKDGDFKVYNVLKTNDYYVFGTTISKDNKINIVDSNDKEVRIIIEIMGNTETKTVLMYSFIENFTNEYFILINGEKITISN